MLQRLFGPAIAVFLLSGCTAPPAPAVKLATPLAAPILSIDPSLAATPPVPLIADDAKAKKDLPTGKTGLDLLLGWPGGTLNGLESVRVFPGTTTPFPGVGKHATAKFFFQTITALNDASFSPKHHFMLPLPLHVGGQYNSLSCIVRFDQPQAGDVPPTSDDYPRLVYVGYFERANSDMAWIEYAKLDKDATLHRHRILFVERDSFTSNEATNYYPFVTDPTPVTTNTRNDGLLCPDARPLRPKQVGGRRKPFDDDGGGGGEM